MTAMVRSNSPFLSTFPGRYYYDSAIFQEEQEHIFGKMWFYVGRADALPSPGSFRVVTVANESIIVARDKEHSLPELCELIPLYRTGKVFADEDFSAGVMLGEQVEAFNITGKASRPPLPGLSPEDIRRYYGLLFLPNMFINLLSDHVVVDTLQPLGPERTLVTSDWLFDPGVMARPDFDASDAVDLLDLVNRQDWVVCELTQKSMTSRAYRNGGNYAPDEHHIRGFVEYVLEKLGN